MVATKGLIIFLKQSWWAAGTTLAAGVLLTLLFPSALNQYDISLQPLVWLVSIGAIILATHGSSLKSQKSRKSTGSEVLLSVGLTLLISILVGLCTFGVTGQWMMAGISGLFCVVLGCVLLLRWSWVALVGVLTVSLAFYAQGYAVMPGDDGTPGMTYARWLATEQTIEFENPIYPELHVPAYNSFIAAEFPLHTVLASMYSLIPDYSQVLSLSNFVILGLFLCSLLSVYVCAKELFQREDWAVVATAITSLFAFYGRAFWGAHFAQILGMIILPLYVVLLHRYMQTGSWKRLVWVGVVFVLLFPLHILTWIVAAVLTAVVLVSTQFQHQRSLWGVGLMLGGIGLGILTIWAAGQIAVVGQLLPSVAVDTAYSQFPSFLNANLATSIGVVLLILGGYVVLQRRCWILAIWFFSTWLLSQSAVAGVPFYATRFDEFFILPVALVLTLAIMTVVTWSRHVLGRQLIWLILLLTLVPTLFTYHLKIAESYLLYTPSFHPATIGQDDLDAFIWLGMHTPPESVIIDVEKFGRFIPVVSGRQRSMLGLEVYTAPTPALRWQTAQTVGADFIVWDEVLTRTATTYTPYQTFTLDFNDPTYFKLVYENSSVKIFKVL